MTSSAPPPIETYLRRPRVLLLDDAPNSDAIASALQRAPVAIKHASSLPEAQRTLRRTYITVIVCDRLQATSLCDAPPKSRSNPSPVFLVTGEPAAASIDELAARPYRLCLESFDRRKLVADVLALAHGWHSARTDPQPLDTNLSVIPDCGLVFCNSQLLPLLRMERLVFALLSQAPSRLVTWTELSTATGASQKLLYVSADRLRRKIEEFLPGHSYIATQPGRGLMLDLTPNG